MAKTIETAKVGDKVFDTSNEIFVTILFIDDGGFLGEDSADEREWVWFHELGEDEYIADGGKPMTIDEIGEELGYPVKIVD